MVEILSASVAVAAFAFTAATYFANRWQNRLNQVDQSFFQLNTLIIQYPDIIFGSEERKAAYAAIVWNFLEGLYVRKLHNESHLKPAMKQLVEMYSSWFKQNRNLYDPRFVDFTQREYPEKFGH